jgi:hypothetical protein
LKESEIEPQPLIIDIVGDNREKTKVDSAIAFSRHCALTVLKRCLKIIDEYGNMVELTPNKKHEYSKGQNAPMLPAKILKSLMQKLEMARRMHPIEKKASKEYIQKFRQAFFDIIIELFVNFKQNNVVINGETVFNAKRLIEESDPAFKEFFIRFLQIDDKNEQSNSQMFNQFLSITS